MKMNAYSVGCMEWNGGNVFPMERRLGLILAFLAVIMIQQPLAGYTKVYASINVNTSKELLQGFWINRTISSSEDILVVDLARLTNEETGLPLWVSHGSDYVSPIILVRLYQKNPSECQNMVERIQNML
jgi:hypothetical protein